jgi:hypothetical protein
MLVSGYEVNQIIGSSGVLFHSTVSIDDDKILCISETTKEIILNIFIIKN